MRTTGTIRDGKIVLDATPLMPDGTRVIVGFEASGDPESFKLSDVKDLQNGWVEAYPGEFDDLYELIRQDREAEVQEQIERDKLGSA